MMKPFFKNYYHLISLSVLVLLIHFYNNVFTTYGIFRDELYYIACTEHLSFGYVDQPPLSILILWINRFLFGDSIFSLRLLPSVAHAGMIFITGIVSLKFGGKKFAQFSAALFAAMAPGITGMFGLYSMNAIDMVLWSVLFLLVIRLIETQEPKNWIWIGIIIGAGLMNKISMGWLAAGLVVGVLATPLRSWLKTPYPWIAAAISVLFFIPYIIWNVQHDFAHLEFARNAAGEKYSSQNQITFLKGMISNFNIFIVPAWMMGWWVLFQHQQKKFRVLFYAIVTVLAILLVNGHSKTEYFNPAIFLLFAAGSVSVEQLFSIGWRRGVGVIYLLLITLYGVVSLPFAIDILPVESFIEYVRQSGEKNSSAEGKQLKSLPQHFADRFGWKELAEDVALAYSSLSSEEKTNTIIYGQNYGEASAVNIFGKTYGLPKAISGHNSYWVWGFEKTNPEAVIVIGGEKENLEETFNDVRLALMHTNEYAMPYESDLPIYICRGLKMPLSAVWERVKHYE